MSDAMDETTVVPLVDAAEALGVRPGELLERIDQGEVAGEIHSSRMTVPASEVERLRAEGNGR